MLAAVAQAFGIGVISLNDDQRHALKFVKNHITGRGRNKGSQLRVLSGAAGVGKSTVLCRAISDVKGPRRIWATSPTHKATKVLRSMMSEVKTAKDVEVVFSTTQSALNLVLKRRQGKDVLVHSGKKPKIRPTDFVVADECSMIDRELFGHIEKLAEGNPRVRVLFLGDLAQLPPVGERHSLSFESGPAVHLTKVVRQQGENPILDVLTSIRQAIERGETELLPICSARGPCGKIGVHVMGSQWERWMPRAFMSDEFEKDFDFARVICYHNSMVRQINQRIQRMRYPNLTTPFAVGEPVSVNAPTKSLALVGQEILSFDESEEDGIRIANQTEGRVRALEKEAHPSFPSFDSWAVTLDLETGGEEQCVYVLDPAARPAYERELTRLRTAAIGFKEQGLGNEARDAWMTYYGLVESFCDLRCLYALTAWRAQGSSYSQVFVHTRDLMSNKNRAEALSSIYVGMSRARLNLMVD